MATFNHDPAPQEFSWSLQWKTWCSRLLDKLKAWTTNAIVDTITVSDMLLVEGDTLLEGSLDIEEDLSAQDAAVSGELSVGEDVNVGGDLFIGRDAFFNTINVLGLATLAGGGTLTGTFTGGTYSGITLSGTVAGTPTFSQAITFTTTATFNSGVTISAPFPVLKIVETDAAADTQKWRLAPEAGVLVGRVLSDDELTTSVFLTLTRTTTTVGTLNFTPTALRFNNNDVLHAGLFATQADQETGTSTTTVVSPGRQHFHPSASKGWCSVTNSGTPTNAGSYNVSSLTDTGVGQVTVNWATDFSSAVHCDIATINGAAEVINTSTKAVGTTLVETFDIDLVGFTKTAVDSNFDIVAFGDHA